MTIAREIKLQTKSQQDPEEESGLLQPLKVPSGLWESISMDLITHLPETKRGNTAIVVFVDRLSKMVCLAPVKTSIDARQYAKLFVKEIFAKHGLPGSIISDRDPRFTSEFFQQLCELLQIKQHMSTAFHPQSDGQTERMNRTLVEMFRGFVGSIFEEWVVHLPSAEFAMNNAFNESIRTTPFFLNYGRHPRTPASLLLPQSKNTDKDFVFRMQKALAEAQRCMRIAQESQARYANNGRREVEYEAEQFVLLDGKNLKLRTENARKLTHRVTGHS